jgi:hypothetical protein
MFTFRKKNHIVSGFAKIGISPLKWACRQAYTASVFFKQFFANFPKYDDPD